MAYKCLGCQKELDATTNITEGQDADDKPVPGAFTICLYCGTICRFTETLDAKPATQDDLLALYQNSPENFKRLVLARVMIMARIKQQ